MQNSKTNSANSANQPETIGGTDNYAPACARRRIDGRTISEIAMLCAKFQMTQAEACRRLGVDPRVWLNWKHKHKRNEKYEALFEEFRAMNIEALMSRIYKSAEGIDLKFPDWRAALAALRVLDPTRFGDKAVTDELSRQPIVSVTILQALAAQVYGIEPKALASVSGKPATDVLALPGPKDTSLQ